MPLNPLAQDVADFSKAMIAKHAPKTANLQPALNTAVDAVVGLAQQIAIADGLPALARKIPAIATIVDALGLTATAAPAAV